MTNYQRFINDEKWKLLVPLLPKAKPSRKGGRHAIDNRQVLEGILWMLRTGDRWQNLPQRYPFQKYNKDQDSLVQIHPGPLFSL